MLPADSCLRSMPAPRMGGGVRARRRSWRANSRHSLCIGSPLASRAGETRRSRNARLFWGKAKMNYVDASLAGMTSWTDPHVMQMPGFEGIGRCAAVYWASVVLSLLAVMLAHEGLRSTENSQRRARARANYPTGVVSRYSNDAIGECAGPLLDDARWLVSRYTCCNVPTVSAAARIHHCPTPSSCTTPTAPRRNA
jgi:hypothetical protein